MIIKQILTKLLSNTFEFDLDQFGKQTFSIKIIPIYKNAILTINNHIIYEVKNFFAFSAPRIFVLSDGTVLEIKLNFVNQRFNFMVLWNGNPSPINVNAKYRFKMTCGGIGIYGFLLSLCALLNLNSHELDAFGIAPHSILLGLIYVGFGFALYATLSIKLLFLFMAIFSFEAIMSQIVFTPPFSDMVSGVFIICIKLIFLISLSRNFIKNANIIKNQKELKNLNLNAHVFFGTDLHQLHGEWVNDEREHYMFSTVGNFIFCDGNNDNRDAFVYTYQVRDQAIILKDNNGQELCSWPFEINANTLKICRDNKTVILRKIDSLTPRVLAFLTKDKSDECFIYPSVLIDPQAN